MGDSILGTRRARERLWSLEQYKRRLLAEPNNRSADEVRRRKALGVAYESLVLTTESGKSVVCEYCDGRRLPNKQMTFPPGTGNNYYQMGDVVLLAKYEKRAAESSFPEFRAPKGSESSLLSVLARGFLELEPPEYKLGYKITAIRPMMDETGDGTIEMQALMFLTDKDVVELEKKVIWTRQQLRDTFSSRKHGCMPERDDIIRKFIGVIMVPLGGRGKKVVGNLTKWDYREALRSAMKQEGHKQAASTSRR